MYLYRRLLGIHGVVDILILLKDCLLWNEISILWRQEYLVSWVEPLWSWRKAACTAQGRLIHTSCWCESRRLSLSWSQLWSTPSVEVKQAENDWSFQTILLCVSLDHPNNPNYHFQQIVPKSKHMVEGWREATNQNRKITVINMNKSQYLLCG